MRKVKKPTDTAENTFLTCISDESLSFRTRLMSCKDEIVSASDEFEKKARNIKLHTIPSATVVGTLTVSEMKGLYTNRMVPKTSPGRPIYNRLLSAANHSRCPLCNQRTVSSLDHHLAKTLHPALAVAPVNLIPACKDCNKIKSAANPKNAEEETLHPYFDDIENQSWLAAIVIQSTPASLQFLIVQPAGSNHLLAKRVKYHFKVFELNKLYIAHSAVELVNIHKRLTKLHNVGGPDSVRLHLEETAESYEEADKNSWQTAMFKTLATDAWFHDGGFRL